MPAIPENCEVGSFHRVAFQVTSPMVHAFARLTADRSSLHIDEVFGRRCLYRRNVAHGILQLLFIAALKPCAAGACLKRIAARFVKPVFPGDRLELKAEVTEVNPEQNLCEIEFSVRHQDSGLVVTNGNFTLSYCQPEAKVGPDRRETAVIPGTLEEECLLLNQINKGDEREFPFQLTPGHAQDLRAILSAGGAEAGALDLANLLGTCLLSTLVGMRMPGKHAVLLDFQIAFQNALQWNRDYLLKGKVSFKSESTLTLAQNVSLRDPAANTDIATGKVSAQVNQPPLQMASFAALQATAADLGLRDKVVLITGASRGIGETTAKLFAVHGARVALNYFRGREDVERIVEEITAHGGSAMAVRADVADRQQVKAMVQSVCGQFQRLDILVNNAIDNIFPVPFLNLTWDSVQRDLDVIVKGAFNCCQEAIPAMLANCGGRIINVSAASAELPPPQQAKSVLAKSALEGLSRSLAVEFAAQNIQVNLVAPSLVETDLTKHIPRMFLDGIKNDTPMKRLATSVDVARAVVFLSSSLASFTTGQKLMVTGGNPPFL
jgi:3-oxoacyl-[acyl-carrier protein] reductase